MNFSEEHPGDSAPYWIFLRPRPPLPRLCSLLSLVSFLPFSLVVLPLFLLSSFSLATWVFQPFLF